MVLELRRRIGDDVLAANPKAESFRKVRLVCSLDTQFSWREFNLVSIVRMILKNMGAGIIANVDLPKMERSHICDLDLRGGAKQAASCASGLEVCVERRVRRC